MRLKNQLFFVNLVCWTAMATGLAPPQDRRLPVEVAFNDFDCEGEACSRYVRETQAWTAAQREAFARDTARQAAAQLADKFQHWRFVAVEGKASGNIWVEATVALSHVNEAAELRLILHSPIAEEPALLGETVLYEAGYFNSWSILPFSEEKDEIKSALETILSQKIQVEDLLKAHVPVALGADWVDRDEGTLALPLSRARHGHLVVADFELWLKDPRTGRMTLESIAFGSEGEAAETEALLCRAAFFYEKRTPTAEPERLPWPFPMDVELGQVVLLLEYLPPSQFEVAVRIWEDGP